VGLMGCVGTKEQKKLPTKENTLKILCLGIGGCGKTTFVKQMKIIHGVGWNNAELVGFRKIIRGNIISGIQGAIDIAAHMGKDISEENMEAFTAIKALTVRNVDFSDQPTQEHIKKLATDPAVLEVCKNHPEKLDQTHLLYFLERFDNYLSEDFPVSDEDILRFRQRTAGANSTLLYYSKKYFDFYDIGGQKPERPKWQIVLSDNDFAAILYFVATDEYDVRDEENEFHDSKLSLSKLIFSELINDSVIQDSKVPIILMLNRCDLFKKRWDGIDSRKSFNKVMPEFKGESAQDALEFLQKLFMAERKAMDMNDISARITCTLNTESMGQLWGDIRDAVLMKGIDNLAI